LISPERLRSTFFTAEKRGNVFYIKGRGWGHGVGMCQWGAKGRAEHGFSYEKILTYYYKDVKLTRINNNYLAHKRGSGNLVN
jgi:stage II sporulation protein D